MHPHRGRSDSRSLPEHWSKLWAHLHRHQRQSQSLPLPHKFSACDQHTGGLYLTPRALRPKLQMFSCGHVMAFSYSNTVAGLIASCARAPSVLLDVHCCGQNLKILFFQTMASLISSYARAGHVNKELFSAVRKELLQRCTFHRPASISFVIYACVCDCVHGQGLVGARVCLRTKSWSVRSNKNCLKSEPDWHSTITHVICVRARVCCLSLLYMAEELDGAVR